MFPATLYKLSKKENSTLKPSAQTPSLPIAVNINDGDSSILSPSIRIPTNQPGLAQNANVFDYNYIYIGQFGRYYYITNWAFNGDGTWTAYCSVDVLATYKTEIMNSPGYIGRAESTYDPTVQDRFYYGRNDPVTIRDSALTYFSDTPNNGVVVLGVATATDTQLAPNTLGGVQYYVLTMSMFCDLVKNLLGIYNESNVKITPQWMNKTNATFTADAWQSLNNPIQYLISCRYYPGKILEGNIVSPPEQIVFGGWKAGGSGGYRVTSLHCMWPWVQPTGSGDGYFTGQIPFASIDMVAPSTPAGSLYDDLHYPAYSPYAKYILQTPWGEFELEPNIMAKLQRQARSTTTPTTPTLYWNLFINVVTGMGTFVVSDTYVTWRNIMNPSTSSSEIRHELLRIEVKVGTDIPLMALFKDDKFEMKSAQGILGGLFDILGAGASGLESIFGMFQGGSREMAGGAISSAIQGLRSTVDLGFSIADACAGPQKTASGQYSADVNCTSLVKYLTVQQTRYPTVGQSNHMYGRPCKVSVSNLNNYDGNNTPFSGFIQMDYTNFTAVCTDTERSSVIKYLLKGVYLE